MKIRTLTLCVFVFLAFTSINAQDYSLVWEDNFDGTTLDPAVWNIEKNVGIWNTGSNQEKQHYTANNVSVGTEDGESCMILTAKNESYNGYEFTSGKVDTRGKFSVKYGKIVARIKLPETGNGLWPAFWLLGYNKYGWPKKGEIDVMEAGQAVGIADGTPNKHIGAALHWDSNGHAMYNTSYTHTEDLFNDFHTFTLEWTDSYIKTFIDDNPTPYFVMTTSGANEEEYRDYSQYLIFNLAVGGPFTGVTDPNNITAPIPANMYIDYVKVYQQDGIGEIVTQNPIDGNFGVFVENKVYEQSLDLNFDAALAVTGADVNGSIAAKEGDKVLAYTTQADQNWSIATSAINGVNMTNYTSGSLQFYIKTNNPDDLTVRITDQSGGEGYVTLNSIYEYNPERDNNWQKVIIPIADFGTGIDFSNMNTFFKLEGVSSSTAYDVAVDYVFWSEILPIGDVLGVFTDNPNITNKIEIDNTTVNLFIWNNNSMTSYSSYGPYEGGNVLSYKSIAGTAWYGYGIATSALLDATAYEDGYLIFTMKTESQSDFWVGIGGNGTEGKIHFLYGSDPYNFKRDGEWQTLAIPMSDLTSQGLDLSACENIFMMGGAPSITGIAIDDVMYSKTSQVPVNPAIAIITPPTTTPDVTTSIDSDKLTETVVYPNPVTSILNIKTDLIFDECQIKLFDTSGRLYKSFQSEKINTTLDMSEFDKGVYILQIYSGDQVKQIKVLKH